MTQSTKRLASIGTTNLFTDRVVQQTKNTYCSSTLSEVNHCSIKLAIKGGLMGGAVSTLLIAAGVLFGPGDKSPAITVPVFLVIAVACLFTAFQATRLFALRIIMGKAEITEMFKRRDLPAVIAFIQCLESAKSCHASTCACDRPDDSPMEPIDGII